VASYLDDNEAVTSRAYGVGWALGECQRAASQGRLASTYAESVPMYRLLDLTTGAVLIETPDRDEGSAALARLQVEGRSFDELDLVDMESGASLLIRGHQSAARLMMAESKGDTYRSFRTLAEAKAAPVAAVIIEGDDGGQIFATCPAALVRCSEDRLHKLAAELETRLNATEYDGSAQVLFEPIPVGRGVAGGMGGGGVIDGVWVHEEIQQIGWQAAVEGILLGTQDELGEPLPTVPWEVRRGVLRAYREKTDVFCHVFGIEGPDYLGKMHVDEWRRREAAVIPPPSDYKRWYPSTLRAVLAELKRSGEA
jgi:hypothetical protein